MTKAVNSNVNTCTFLASTLKWRCTITSGLNESRLYVAYVVEKMSQCFTNKPGRIFMLLSKVVRLSHNEKREGHR